MQPRPSEETVNPCLPRTLLSTLPPFWISLPFVQWIIANGIGPENTPPVGRMASPNELKKEFSITPKPATPVAPDDVKDFDTITVERLHHAFERAAAGLRVTLLHQFMNPGSRQHGASSATVNILFCLCCPNVKLETQLWSISTARNLSADRVGISRILCSRNTPSSGIAPISPARRRLDLAAARQCDFPVMLRTVLPQD